MTFFANLSMSSSGATNQWNHAVHQGDVLVLQALHVSHNVGLRMITGEKKQPEDSGQMLYYNNSHL